MKNITCPVSFGRVEASLPRVTAFFVVLLMGFYFLVDSWVVLAFLVVDFFIRGFVSSKYSLLARLSVKVVDALSLRGALVGSAPKVFASRLGFGMVVAIFLLHLLVGGSVPLLLGVVLVVLASLEGVFGFCVGCYVYSFLVLPWLRNV